MTRFLYWHVPTWGHNESYFRLTMHIKKALARREVFLDLLYPGFFHLPGVNQEQFVCDQGAGNTVFAGTCGDTGGFHVKVGRVWAFTMWESTRLPADWVRNINAGAERLLVPCRWCAEAFRESVKVGAPPYLPADSIHTVPLGVDPEEYPYIQRPERDTFTFLALGDRGDRKGWSLLMQAFIMAFGEYGKQGSKADVRLLFKMFRPNTSLLAGFHHIDDRRIRVWSENVASMLDLYFKADAFVFPSRAEGWGLPPREAAATGLPVISTDYSGMAGDVVNWGQPLRYTEVDASDMYTGLGKWANPDLDHLVELLRWCYEKREAAREMGRKASAWLHANQTWDHSAAAFIEVLDTYGRL